MSGGTDLRSHWTLDPKVTFLNHGSFGATLAEVQEYQQDYRERLEREPVDFLVRQLPDLWEASRNSLATFLGADPKGLVFVSNATDGVGAVLRSLTFEPGDQLVCTNHGYNACNNVLGHVATRFGAEVVVAQVPFPLQDPGQVETALEDVLTDRTKLVLIDHVTSPTGLIFPVEKLVRSLQARGIQVLVDGAHAPGMLPLNLDELGADYYVGNGHKWMCAPKSVGFLYVRAEHRDSIVPTTISHGANKPREGYSRLQDQFDWPGTQDPTPVLCLKHSMEILATLVPGGWPEIYSRNHELVLQGRDLLCNALQIEAPAPDSMLGSLAAVPLPSVDPGFKPGPFDPDPLHSKLWKEHQVEVPIVHYPGEPARLLRISAHLHNRVEDYERLIQVLS